MLFAHLRAAGATVAVIPFLALIIAAPPPAVAGSQTCTSMGDFDWIAVDDADDSNWDCTDSDSPGPDDHFVISHQVTIAGDIEQDGFAPGAGITVRAGGGLVAANPVTLTLGEDGLVCEPGSACSLRGSYRQLALQPMSLENPESEESFTVGDVVPCPDQSGLSDCDDPTLRQRVRFQYPSERYPDHARVCASFAQVDDGGGAGRGDVLALWNPEPSDLFEGTDTNFWYEILGASAVEPCSIDISVHQGQQDQDGYPLARRDVASYKPNRNVFPGDRDIEFAEGTLPGSDYHDGRMLRFESGGDPGDTTYRIYDSRAGATSSCADGVGPCDLLRLADQRGVAAGADIANADEDRVWVDYGWEPGDPFLLIAPVRIAAAEGALGRVPVRLYGTVDLRATVLYRTDTLFWRADAPGSCTDVWLEDLQAGAGDKLLIESAIDCERISATGGDADASLDISHTIVAKTSDTVALRAVGLRHAGDDFFSVISGFDPTVRLERFRAQFKSTNAPSDECIASGSGAVRLTGADIECIDAVRTGANFGPRATPGSSFDVSSAAVISSRGAFWFSTFGDTFSTFSDVTIIGSDLYQRNAELMPMNVDRFVVRDSVHRGGRLLNGSVGYAHNGIVKDNRIEDEGLAITVSDISLENIAFIRNGSPGAVNLVNANQDPASGSVWRNILVVAEAGNHGFQRLWRFGTDLTDLSGFTLGGLAFVGHTGPPANRVLLNQSGIPLDDPVLGPTFESPFCFFNNDVDADEATLEQLPAGTIWAIAPEFSAPGSDRYDSVPGSPWDLAGCGVRSGPAAPGVHSFQRYHAWSNLVPEGMAAACNNGIDDDQDGDVDFPADVGCKNPESWNESPRCQDGIDNDSDGYIDWDGGGVGPADPQCGSAHRNSEKPRPKCGLTAGVAALVSLLLPISALRRSRPRAAVPAPEPSI